MSAVAYTFTAGIDVMISISFISRRRTLRASALLVVLLAAIGAGAVPACDTPGCCASGIEPVVTKQMGCCESKSSSIRPQESYRLDQTRLTRTAAAADVTLALPPRTRSADLMPLPGSASAAQTPARQTAPLLFLLNEQFLI